MEFLKFIATVPLIVAAVAAAVLFLMWREHCDDADLQISFAQFRRDYFSVPDVFTCSMDFTLCKIAFHNVEPASNMDGLEDDFDDGVYIKFSYIDYIRYVLWLMRKNRVSFEKKQSNARYVYASYFNSNHN